MELRSGRCLKPEKIKNRHTNVRACTSILVEIRLSARTIYFVKRVISSLDVFMNDVMDIGVAILFDNVFERVIKSQHTVVLETR